METADSHVEVAAQAKAQAHGGSDAQAPGAGTHPRHGVSTLPPVARYAVRLADDALLASYRLGEWIARAPQIEEDMALANIGLDLLGQARALFSYAGRVEADATGDRPLTEDDFAYFRDEREFTCVHLVEQPRGDFAFTIARQLVFATYQLALYEELARSTDATLAAVAAKAVKEVTYHRDHAVQWTLRLGDGTDVSHERMAAGLRAVWPYVPELFDDDNLSEGLAVQGIGVAPSTLRGPVLAFLADVIGEARLSVPEPSWRSRGGRQGIHSEALGHTLPTMQHLARSFPGAHW